MTWFKVDDHLHSHSKTMRAGTEAMGLWVIAGSWAAAEESDGWVPAYALQRLVGAGGEDLAARLVRAGLWTAEDRDGEDGYQFHAWGEYQPTAASLEAKREAARLRMAAARSGGVRANSEGTARDVRPTPTRPDPTKNNTAAKAAESDEFAAFWSAYPRKTSKAAAAKAYDKARKSADAAAILAGLQAATAEWQAARTELRFIPHPATWLNQGRWEDVHAPLPGTPAAQGPTRTANQCDTVEPHNRHPWDQGRNAFMCLGVTA